MENKKQLLRKAETRKTYPKYTPENLRFTKSFFTSGYFGSKNYIYLINCPAPCCLTITLSYATNKKTSFWRYII